MHGKRNATSELISTHCVFESSVASRLNCNMRIDNLQKKQTFEFPIDNQRIIHMQFSFSEHSQGLRITKELAIKYVVLNLGNCKAEILIFLEKSLPQEFSKLFLPTLKVVFLVLKFS